jgi:hypothetical protein
MFRGSPSTMPVPWDPVHLAAWTHFIARLVERYRDHPAIALVHMTDASANGFEMQLPFTPEDRQGWQRIGYTTDRHSASWRSVIDAFAAAFPHTGLRTRSRSGHGSPV